MRIRTLIVILGLITFNVHASDGVFEINADCAIVGGCFDGDSGGYPVTITDPGSYRLTGNLTTTSTNTTLITVSADDVTIDLNGFSLIGPVTCSGSPNTCTSGGSGDGIRASNNAFSVSVFNGTVRGMGDDGIFAGNNSIIENVKVIENEGDGISLAGTGGSLAKNITARRNGGHGIVTGFGASHYVMDSNLTLNSDRGQFGGACSNIFSISNGQTSSCLAVGPNRCETPTACD